MTAAARNLTPVILEVGGKNPTIVHSSANLPVAARRISQGRWQNAGQTCTVADHVLLFKESAGAFLERLKAAVVTFYGEDPQQSPDYGRIINLHCVDRLVGLLASGDVYHGGQHDRDDRYIAPTILVDVPPDAPIMQDEVFGQILPVLEVESVEEVLGHVHSRPKPPGL
jgi:aldehyde dehydrogenase (NAD+)